MEAKFAFVYQLQITQQKKKKNYVCVGVKLFYPTFYSNQHYQRIKRWDFCVPTLMLKHLNKKMQLMYNALMPWTH